jgi:hypothetical protein
MFCANKVEAARNVSREQTWRPASGSRHRQTGEVHGTSELSSGMITGQRQTHEFGLFCVAVLKDRRDGWRAGLLSPSTDAE